MRGKKIVLIGLIVIAIPVLLLAGSYMTAQPRAGYDGKVAPVYEIGLNEAAGTYAGRQVVIPRTWRLIGVSNGLQPYGNSLWFQDKDGSVYLITGFYQSGQFFISPPFVGRILAAQE